MTVWQPITAVELSEIVDRQLSNCSPSQRSAFEAARVPFYAAPLYRLGAIEPVLVVAEIGDSVIYFEDVEEGFEIAKAGLDGVLPEPSNMQFELCHVLHRAGL